MRSLLLLAFCFLAISCHSHPSIQVSDLKSYETTFNYSFTVEEITPDSRKVSVWIPLPSSNHFQKIRDLKLEPEPSIRTDAVYGNQIAHLTWKAPFNEQLQVKCSYNLERKEEIAHPEKVNSQLMDRYLEPDNMGIVDDHIKEMSVKVTASKTGTMEKARAIYDFVIIHMTYNKKIPGWGKGDTKRACTTPYGNCSDYHSLFISLARAAKIPARFHYGYSLKPEGKVGPHCWAQFYDKTNGWVPVDISEADKDPSRTEYFFGRLSENRVVYSTGRDIVLNPPQRDQPLNFIIEPYIEVDGKPHTKLRIESGHVRKMDKGK